MTPAILPAPQVAVPFDFANWEQIPVKFGHAAVTLAEARVMLAAAIEQAHKTLSEADYAEKGAIWSAINRADWLAKGLSYRAPKLTPRQAVARTEAVRRIEARLVAAQSLCAA